MRFPLAYGWKGRLVLLVLASLYGLSLFLVALALAEDQTATLAVVAAWGTLLLLALTHDGFDRWLASLDRRDQARPQRD